jgi:hypothetical protein
LPCGGRFTGLKVPIGERGAFEGEQFVSLVADRDALDADDAPQVGDIADKASERMKGSGQAHLDWKLGMVICDTHLPRLEQLEL